MLSSFNEKDLVLDNIDLVDRLNAFIRNIGEEDEDNAIDYYNKTCNDELSNVDECHHFSSKEKQKKITQATELKIENIK